MIVFILAGILIFGFLVATHELGHFTAAKLCGVKVNEYSVGMGPAIWSRQKGETQYSLRAIPLGGYCAMEGEEGESDDDRCLQKQSFWKQFIIMFAGPFTNFVTGFLILLLLYSGASTFYTDEISFVSPERMAAADNMLLPGDQIYKVNSYRTYVAGDAALYLHYMRDGETSIEVIRNGEHITVDGLTRGDYTGKDGKTYHGFGITFGRHGQEATLGAKFQYTWNTARDFVQQVRFSLVQLVSGTASVKDLNGPVGIVSTISQVGAQAQTSQEAWFKIAFFAALIAVNLAVMNLLPIPALDGGRIFFLAIDALSMLLFKKKVPEKYQIAANTASFVVLMGFMLLVTFQDVFKLFR